MDLYRGILTGDPQAVAGNCIGELLQRRTHDRGFLGGAPVIKALMLTAALMAAGLKNHANLDRPASESDLLRAFGFATCVAKAYDKTPFADDAERVADGYRQMGKLGKAYDEVRSVVDLVDAAKPTSVGHSNLALMTCLEWYESAKTKRLIREIASRPGNQ